MKGRLLVMLAALLTLAPAGARADSSERTPPFDAGEVCYRIAGGVRCARDSALDPGAIPAMQAREGKLVVGTVWQSQETLTILRSAAIASYTPPRAGVLSTTGGGGVVGDEFCLGISRVGTDDRVEQCFPGTELGWVSVEMPVVAGAAYESSFAVRWTTAFLPGAAKVNHIDLHLR